MSLESARMKTKTLSSGKSAADPAPSAAAVAFRSPVGCTAPTSGEKEFLAWCNEERVRFPSSHLATLPATGRALVASRGIKMGEVVVEVPDDAVLMADNCSIRDILEEEGMCKPADDEILEVQGLIIAVMYEKSRGKESRWAPYLNVLPDDMTHMPLYWKRCEFQELRGTAAYDKMMGQVQHPADAPTQVPLLWSEVVEPFISEHPELGIPAGQAGYDLYRWATCAVASYSFILGDDKYQAMVPVWDLLNHITGQVNVRLHHCAKRHVLQMIATRDISRGEELVNNYGELSNAELLRGYGFVELRNKNNHVQIPLGFVVRAAGEVAQAEAAGEQTRAAAASSAEVGTGAVGPGPGSAAADVAEAMRQRMSARLRLAGRCGLLPLHHVFKVFPGRGPPANMTALIHLLLASDAEAAALRRSARRAAAAAEAGAAAAGDTADRRGKKAKPRKRSKAGQQAAEKAVTEVAVVAAQDGGEQALGRVALVYDRVVQRMLGRYSNDLEEDERLMSRRETLPSRLAAAVLARKPEKEVLLDLKETVVRTGALLKSLLQPQSTGAAQARGKSVAARGSGDEDKAPGRGDKVGAGVAANGHAKGAGGGRSASDSGNDAAAGAQFSFGFML